MKKAIVISDQHCGSLVGLACPKDFDDKTVITQKPLWDWFAAEIKQVGKVDIVVNNGDAVDGPGHRDTIGHKTTDTREQREIFYRAMEPIKTKQWFFTFGTPYHVTGSEDWEKQIAEHYGATIRDILFLDIEGHKCRFRHFIGRSNIPYGQGTPLFKEVVRDMIQALEEEASPADHLFGSHVHYSFNMGHVGQKEAYTTPCLQVPESVYGRKQAAAYYDLGFLEIQASKNDFRVIPHICPIKFVRKREYIKI